MLQLYSAGVRLPKHLNHAARSSGRLDNVESYLPPNRICSVSLEFCIGFSVFFIDDTSGNKPCKIWRPSSFQEVNNVNFEGFVFESRTTLGSSWPADPNRLTDSAGRLRKLSRHDDFIPSPFICKSPDGYDYPRAAKQTQQEKYSKLAKV